jgi:hypothetical protein
MLTWTFDELADSTVWTINEQTSKQLIQQRKVHFDSQVTVYHVPTRHELNENAAQLWWSRHELGGSSQQATFAVRETMSKNPSLTVESGRINTTCIHTSY